MTPLPPGTVQLLMEYRASAPGSRAFKTLLIELVAVAVHQIAALLLELGAGLHQHDGIADWVPPKSDLVFWIRNPQEPYPTLFSHRWYRDYNQYPRGAGDMAGYWAEARIFGGVVLFDRRGPDTEHADPQAVYFHSDRREVTYRIYQLLPEQQKSLLDFLLADEVMISPLPILGRKDNQVRIDPEEPIRETGIYRDLWERKDYLSPSRGPVMKDIRNYLDYPTEKDQDEAAVRVQLRKMRRRAADRAERLGGRSET